jgi:hypothetical protein
MPAGSHKRSGLRRALLAAVAVIVLAVFAFYLELAIPKHDYFLERRGTLVRQEILAASENGTVHKTVRLESSSGLEIDMRLARPATEAGETLPVIVVMGGEGTGKDAVDLVGEPDGVAYLALDYPYRGSQELDAFWESISAIPAIQQAFLDSPPAMSLAILTCLAAARRRRERPLGDARRSPLHRERVSARHRRQRRTAARLR